MWCVGHFVCVVDLTYNLAKKASTPYQVIKRFQNTQLVLILSEVCLLNLISNPQSLPENETVVVGQLFDRRTLFTCPLCW